MFEFSKRIKIGQMTISQDSPVCMIAEAGVNHDGKLAVAKKMIDVAATTGADMIKFQTFDTDEFIADRKMLYSYQVRGKVRKEPIYAMFKRLELRDHWYGDLVQRCRQKKIQFLSTPCDPRSVDLLDRFGVPAYKISSEDLINVNLITYVAQRHKPVILSTGMANKKEIDIAVNIFRKYHHKDLILLHCTSLYPTPPKETNLERMRSLAQEYDVLVGFSDHTVGHEAALGAVYMGAVLIEKHFTLSQQMSGPDHWMSIEPNDLKRLVANIRQAETLKGNRAIEESKTEKTDKVKYRRSIVAARDLSKGITLREEHLTYKRPGNGLKPYEKDKLLGRILKRDVKKDVKLLTSMVTKNG